MMMHRINIDAMRWPFEFAHRCPARGVVFLSCVFVCVFCCGAQCALTLHSTAAVLVIKMNHQSAAKERAHTRTPNVVAVDLDDTDGSKRQRPRRRRAVREHFVQRMYVTYGFRTLGSIPEHFTSLLEWKQKLPVP